MKTVKTGTKIGALIGTIVFLAFGTLPAFYFGSYGTLVLLSKLAGSTVEPTTFVRTMVVMGVLLGEFCAGAVSIVLGSVFGTSMGYIVSLFEAKSEVTDYETVRN